MMMSINVAGSPRRNIGFETVLKYLHYIHYRQYRRKLRQLRRLENQARKLEGRKRAPVTRKINAILKWIEEVYEKRSRE